MGALIAAVAVVAAGAAALAAYLRGDAAARRAPERQAELERAVAAIDRELAADLELMATFDQTKRAFVLENASFAVHGVAIAREAAATHAFVSDVYARILATESAMERRGPAGSIADADLALIHEWEGDAREAQRLLRASLTPPRRSRWALIVGRLRAGAAAR